MKTRKPDLKGLDDVGRIGGEREFTESDAQVVSAYIQAAKAKRSAAKKVPKRATAKRKAKSKSRV